MIPIHSRFLSEAVNHNPPVTPTILWVWALVLKKFDTEITKAGIIALRYADDLALFGENEMQCKVALALIKKSLSILGLSIPELGEQSKTIIVEPSKEILFLGVHIKRFDTEYRLCAPFKKLEEIEKKMASMCSRNFCIKEKRTLSELSRTLDSFVIGHSASMAAVINRDEFTNRLRAAQERCLKALLVGLIGEKSVAKLDRDRKAILGLEPFSAGVAFN
ncbi:MAG: hypothetical protein WDN46_19355 [Methylocella sp.]